MTRPNKVDFITSLCNGLHRLAIQEPSPQTLQQLAKYFDELDKWRRKINLVARAEPAQIIENHFLDSLTLLPLLEEYKNNTSPSLLDIGSGAGFPGLVIKIACPWLRVILVEPRQKRVSFLKHIIRTLHLTDIVVREERLAVDDQQFLQNYDKPNIITSRAVADIKASLEMLTFAPLQSKIICMKGPKAETEIEAWHKTKDSPFTLIAHQHFTLPLSGAERALIIFGKKTLPD